MKKNIITILIIIGVLLFLLVLSFNPRENNAINSNTNNSREEDPNLNNSENNQEIKLQIINFHGTQRCVSCINIGKYTKAALEENFSEDLKTGMIEFREVNGELPENKDLVFKFKAMGSSLFFNTITNGEDSIYEDARVWMLAYQEEEFKKYIKIKVNALLKK